jgi:hypothetical protein
LSGWTFNPKVAGSIPARPIENVLLMGFSQVQQTGSQVPARKE